jgi:hypothetical protein
MDSAALHLGGERSFQVINGQSATWGQFGQSQGLSGVNLSTSLSDLGAYKPNYSVAKSGVSWESNRVTSMTLVQVRYYKSGQLIATDSNPRSVLLIY